MIENSEQAAEAWAHHIPHYELSEDLLPRPQAPWEELVYFAGAFDGTAVIASMHGLQPFALGWRERFLKDGELPGGLTMLRTALQGEQRVNYWSDEGDPEPAGMRHVHALVERIRELVKAGVHLQPDPATDDGVRDRVMNAFDRLVAGYARWGGYRYHGWTSYEDPKNYLGPVIWSERDCDLRFAMELEREFPERVHMEFAIAKYTRADYDPTKEAKQRVDLAVSDLSAFGEDDESYGRFRGKRHQAFFEVKWFLNGFGDNRDARNRLAAIPAYRDKLAHHAELDRCAVAGMLIVDDEDYGHANGYYRSHHDAEQWPSSVWLLYLGRWTLIRRGLLAPE